MVTSNPPFPTNPDERLTHVCTTLKVPMKVWEVHITDDHYQGQRIDVDLLDDRVKAFEAVRLWCFTRNLTLGEWTQQVRGSDRVLQSTAKSEHSLATYHFEIRERSVR